MFSADALTTLPWAVVLSAIALFLAWRAYRADAYALAVRRVGWATLAWAVWLVGLMQLVVRIGGAVADWAAGFVLRPSVWLGVAVGILGLLLVVGGTVARRRSRGEQISAPEKRSPDKRSPGERTRPGPDKQSAQDDDMADIEEILRRHGIE